MRSKILPCIAISAAITFCFAAAVSARANVIFELGNHLQQPDEQNILFKTNQMGSLIFGHTNKTNTTIDFSSITDILETPSKGQARIVAQDGVINGITISAPGFTFTGLIFDLQTGNLGPSTADVTVNLLNQSPVSFLFPLSNGENFLTLLVASGGERITSVEIQDSTGFSDLREPRISGLEEISIPEPAAFLLLGSGLFWGIGGLAQKHER